MNKVLPVPFVPAGSCSFWTPAGLVLSNMWSSVLTVVLAALAVAADAKPLEPVRPRSIRHVVHEEIPAARSSWLKSHRVHESSTLPVRIGLTQQNLHRAEEFIHDVSHPESPNYGKHWSAHQIIEMFKPAKDSIDAVMDWLAVEGIHPTRIRLSPSKSWLTFNATVREVEQMLKTKYHVYKNEHSKGGRHIACDKYHVPEHLVEHIDIITPTVHFDQLIGYERHGNRQQMPDETVAELKKRSDQLKKRDRPSTAGIIGSPDDGSNPKQGHVIENAMMDLSQCDSMITPECLQALYDMPRGRLAAKSNTLGIVEYTPQAFLQSDLDMYFKEFQPSLKGKSPIVKLLDNAVVQTQNKSFNFNGESALDLEFAMALIHPQQATLYQVGDTTQGASFNNFLDGIDGSFCDFEGGDSSDPNVDGQYSSDVNCGTTPPTNVISTSYGSNEADLSAKYELRQCDEYMKLALQGVTVVYSSGDFGVAGNGDQCINEDGTAYTDGKTGQFNPSFPGGCPWVTSVGATQIRNGSTVRKPEAACEEVIRSGGGFSNVFSMPTYQERALGYYYENHAPDYGSDKYNNSRVVRGFPDVSANGANYLTAVDGNFTLSYGTSGKPPTIHSKLDPIMTNKNQ